jgi:pimeloyl-ACP methyl ester carboxylesterase
MTITTTMITASDGRQLEVGHCGDASYPTVVVHHGTPGCHLILEMFANEALMRGYFLVSVSRPGYGQSQRHPGRIIGDVVSDVHDALRSLGRDGDYVTMGWSGGGPHALACAATSARCRGAVILAGVAPYEADIDWFEGMAPENLEEFGLAVQGGSEFEAVCESMAEGMRTLTVDSIVESFGGLIDEPDRRLLDDVTAREELVHSFLHAVRQGGVGFCDDDMAFVRYWGFDLSDIAVPVDLWWGDFDRMVPATHAPWMVAQIPSATATHLPDEGHISVVLEHLGKIFNSVDEMMQEAV